MTEYGPAVRTLVEAQLARNEKHATFLRRRFDSVSAREMKSLDKIADDIISLCGNKVDQIANGYEFICKIQKEEELYFRRHKNYRLTRFQDALDQVYSNAPYMDAYMRGLLATQLFWSNHSEAIDFYSREFLANLSPGAKLLEIGPGHGLLLARAARALGPEHVTGWDVSAASLDQTRWGLRALGVADGFNLVERNLFEARDEKFDAIVFSEVLEHLEEPERALTSIRSLLNGDGRLFINVPINSPAPDHIFLLRSPEEAFDLVKKQGFQILQSECFAATNYSMEQALKHKLTITVCMVVTPC